MKLFATVLLLAASAVGQVTTARRSIVAAGEADVAVAPDQARLSVAVVTQATTADEAVLQNAAAAQAVISAVNALFANAGSVRTVTTPVSLLAIPSPTLSRPPSTISRSRAAS